MKSVVTLFKGGGVVTVVQYQVGNNFVSESTV